MKMFFLSFPLFGAGLRHSIQIYTLVVGLCLIQSAWAQQPPAYEAVQWTRGELGTDKLTTGANGALTKTAGGSTTWNAGAVSTQRMLRDGSIKFQGNAGGLSAFIVGLNLVDKNELSSDMDHAIYLRADNLAQVYHGATPGVSLGTFTASTVFTISRVGSTVLFYKDTTLMHTSTTASAGIMMVDCSFFKQVLPTQVQLISCQIATGDLDNDGMADAWEEEQLPPLHSWTDVANFRADGDADLDGVSNKLEFQMGTLADDSLSRSVPVTWLRDTASQLNTDLTADAGGIKKTTPGTAAAYNARAFASQIIAEDGQMIFKIKPGTIVSVGLNTSNVLPAASSVTTDLEWSIVTAADGTFDINPNTTDISLADPLGSYTADTVFCIQRTAGQVRFLKDGVVLHTAVASSYGILYPNVWLSSPTAELTLAHIDTGDMDTDGLPDVWERQFLKADSGWNDLDAFSPLGNADGTVIINNHPVSTGDTNSNVEEFRDGTSPIDRLSKAESVVWRSDLVNATAGGAFGGLTKNNAAPPGYSARAFGTKAILEDGIVSFQVSGNGIMSFGLNTSSAMPLAANGAISTAAIATPDLEWAFTTTDAGTYTVKPNATAVTPASSLNTFDASTRFMIQRLGGVVRFFRNGVVVHTAAAKSSGPLYVNVWLSTQTQQLTLARVYTGDIDNDGMPDAWELSYLAGNAGYSELDAFKATGAGLASDPDGDGVENLDEYFDGTNPLFALMSPQAVLWIGNSTTPNNPLSLPQINDATGGVKKTFTTAGWNVDAVASKLQNPNDVFSPRLLLAIKQTGRISFTANPNSNLALGLTYSDGYRTQNDLEFMIQLTATETASVFEGTGGAAAAVLKQSLGSYDANTRFSIRRVMGQIEYLKDGVVYYTSTATVPASAVLYVDSSFSAVNSEITSARLYSGDVDEDGMPDEWEIIQYQRLNNGSLPTFTQLQAFAYDGHADGDNSTNLQEYLHGSDPLQQLSVPSPINWNVSPPTTILSGSQGGLTKLGTTVGDATSTETLTGDGTLSFCAVPGILAVGLTYADNSNSDTDLEYAFILSATEAKTQRPESTTDLSVGAYTASTVFAIRRTGQVIEFLKDGVVVETSMTLSTGDLYADCSFTGAGTQISSAYMNNGDVDADGLPDTWELSYLPLNSATAQLQGFTPTDYGSDYDGVSNLEEYLNGTSAVLADTDYDGMSDRWEIDHGLAANDSSNAPTDNDNDGLSNFAEYQLGTNPSNADSDYDGIPDGHEVQHGTLPLNPSDALADKDGDRIPNLWEYSRGTSLSNANSVPSWNAIIDPSINQDIPAENRYISLSSAYASLPADVEYRATILFRRNRERYYPAFYDAMTFDASSVLERKIAIIAEGGAEQASGVEGVILSSPIWSFKGDVFINGLIFEGRGNNTTNAPLKFSSSQAGATKVRLVNCLFRRFQPQRPEAGPDANLAGAINNYGTSLALEHCTLMNCSSWMPAYSLPVSSISNFSGSLSLKNCIVWDGNYSYSYSAILGGVSNASIETSIIQGDGVSQWPYLHLNKGYLTFLSLLRDLMGAPTTVKRDIHGQIRSLSAPTVGAVEWVDQDQDAVPDWWERWWFGEITTNSFLTITNPNFPNVSLHEHFENYHWDTTPSQDQDADTLPDIWEYEKLYNLLDSPTGNPDLDGRNNEEEFLADTNPLEMDRDFDSDNDQIMDWWEILHFGSASVELGGAADDFDHDGATNLYEYLNDSNPTLADQHYLEDSDTDGLSNGFELSVALSNPVLSDTNGDGIDDYIAYHFGLNSSSDSDGDGLTLAQEQAKGSNAIIYDTDGDGVGDKDDYFPLDPTVWIIAPGANVAGLPIVTVFTPPGIQFIP